MQLRVVSKHNAELPWNNIHMRTFTLYKVADGVLLVLISHCDAMKKPEKNAHNVIQLEGHTQNYIILTNPNSTNQGGFLCRF